MLGTDYRDNVHLGAVEAPGVHRPVDAFFDHCFGRLPYRSLDFEHVTRQLPPGQSRLLPAGTINHPNDSDYTRVTDFKQLTGRQHGTTSLVYGTRAPTATSTARFRGRSRPRCTAAKNPKLSSGATSALSAGSQPASTTTWTRPCARRWRSHWQNVCWIRARCDDSRS